jgi:hypothetical protein
MKQTAKRSGRGGARPGSGRKPAGRRQIVLRIRSEIIDQLEPGAARKMRDFIEQKFKSP